MRQRRVFRIVALALALVALGACQGVPTTDGGGPEATVAPTGAPTATGVAPTTAPSASVPSTTAPPATAAPVVDTPTSPATPTLVETPTVTDAPTAVPAVDAVPAVEVVASGLVAPWALAWAPDGRLFVAERPGRLRVIVNDVLQPEPVAEIPVAATGEGGLMGLVLDPEFDENGFVYIMYTYSDGGRLANRISRWVLRDGQLLDEQVLVDGIAGARNHDGGRLGFGPDGMLYATTGDAGNGRLAQDTGSLNGKILRLNPDGSVPADNPFPGSPVYSYGHRNPQGLAWQPETGQLLSTEHGPSGERGQCCRDEVNVIMPGANYGWPEVAGSETGAGYVAPLVYSGDDVTWAPAGAAFYTGDDLPAWRGSLLFGTLRGQHLHRIALDGVTVVTQEALFENVYGRLREVAMGPDGNLYVTTSNRDGRGTPAGDDDRILRIVAE